MNRNIDSQAAMPETNKPKTSKPKTSEPETTVTGQVAKAAMTETRVDLEALSVSQGQSVQEQSSQGQAPSVGTKVFRISPLIRITLLSLYGALTLPLPFLASVTHASVSPTWLSLGLVLGAVILAGALSERVVVDSLGIQVTYPAWARLIWRRGWSLRWPEITRLKPRSTGQGGLVYYFLTEAGDQAYLLPMRVAGFGALVREVQAYTEIDTTDVKPLAQPWMYLILLGFTLLLLLIDTWVLAMALSGQLPVEMSV